MAPKLAQKRAPLEEDPPSASSSSSSEEDNQPSDNEQEETHTQETPKQTPEESESESVDEEESDDDEQQQTSAQKPTSTTTTVTRTPQPNSPSSGSDSGSDSETGPDQPTSASDFTIKPIASKPMEKKPSASKRPVATESGEKSGGKRKKAKVEPEEEKKFGGGVNRLWREDDEAALLRGMAEFQSKKGVDPYSAMGEFHEFVKKSLSVEVWRAQLMDKVRRMKKKYENNAVKGENGSDPVFSKPHEHKCFELSKKVWGAAKENGSNGVVEENGNVGKSSSKRARKTVKLEDSVVAYQNGKKDGVKGEVRDVKVDDDAKLGDFWSGYPCLKQSLEAEADVLSMKEPVRSFMVEGLSAVGKAKAKELERKWKILRQKEVALYLRRLELMNEQTKLVLDAVKALRD